jgi:hypothetical protein
MQEQRGFNMSEETQGKRGDPSLIREWIIFHKDDPEKKVRLRTLRTLTALQVKEKIVSNGLFSREVITELRVRQK